MLLRKRVALSDSTPPNPASSRRNIHAAFSVSTDDALSGDAMRLADSFAVRRPKAAERPALLGLWERSVRATHTFLIEADITFYRPLTAEFLASDTLELWVITDQTDTPIGFMGLDANAIEALFLEPAHRGRGCGRRLVDHAQALGGGALTVDVNEQNAAARGFYERLGFTVVSRSPVDPTGRPYPLLHMRRKAP